MLKPISRWILYKRCKWTTNITVDIPPKCIICFAPHTSNWDFVIGVLFNLAEGIRMSFLMKKALFRWPLGYLFRGMGGIPVYRHRNIGLTDLLAEKAINSEKFCLCVAAEGTRALSPKWRLGFYYIAIKANIPILLFAEDYEKKLIQCTKVIIPNGDLEGQMKEVKLYYKDFTPRKPEKFTVGEI